MKHLISCDRCNTLKQMIHDSTDQRNDPTWILPEDWHNINGLDLCPKCSSSFEQWLGKSPSTLNLNKQI